MQNKFLFAAQVVGALLFATVCVAFIFGLQATTGNVVLHDQLSFRIVLGASGSLFLVMVAAGIVWALKSKPKTS
jgi:hypothetical protein